MGNRRGDPIMKIVFDLDGTLIDVSRRHWHVYSKILQSYGKLPIPYLQYWHLKRDNTPWLEILKLSQFDGDATAEFIEIFISEIETVEHLKIDTVFNDTFSTLDSLKNHELYLVSLRRNDAHFRAQLDWLKLRDYFKETRSGHTEKEGHHKKNEIIKKIAQKQSAIVIGDTETDVLAAKSLNLESIAVTTGIRSSEFLRQLEPDYLIDNLKAALDIVSN